MSKLDIGNGSLWLGDCLELMKDIPDGSVDMVLCDLPYGTTACKWDQVIPFEPLWKQYWRVCKPNAAVVLTAAFPFTAALAMSNIKRFRYSLVWDKVNKYTGALNANRMPLRRHEDVLIFYRSLPTYNKQYRDGKPFIAKQTRGHGSHTQYGNDVDSRVTVNNGNHNPCSILEIKGDNKLELGLHPTQKPVALFEYLIKTYTDEDMTVLDNCSGSGTTAVAAQRSGRRWIAIEKDPEYYIKSVGRLCGEVDQT